MRALMCTLALASTLAFAQRNADLEKAQQALAAKKYDVALKALDTAAKKGGLDRDSMLTLLESRGLAEASLGQAEQAERSFRAVLQLDGKRDLTGKYTGKAALAVAAAKDWFKANGGIELGALDPGVDQGQVTQVSLFVKNDPLQLVARVRFYLRIDGGAWKPVEAKVINGVAATDTRAAAVDWWAEALSERNDQLLFFGSAGRPVKQAAPAVVAKVEPVASPQPVEKPVELTPVKETAPAPTSSSSSLRPVGYVLLGAGVAAAGVGAYFGVTSTSMREAIKADLAAGGGDQAALYARDQQAITNATVANVLFVSAGALAVTGGVLWFLGRDVQVTPVVGGGGGGVLVSGQF